MLWGLPYLFVLCDVEPSANGQVVSDQCGVLSRYWLKTMFVRGKLQLTFCFCCKTEM